MITRAKVSWEVDVTLDIPECASTYEAQNLIVAKASEDILMVRPKVVSCVERPDTLKVV